MAIPERTDGHAAQHRAPDRRNQPHFTAEGPRTPEKGPQTRAEPAQRRHFTNKKFTTAAGRNKLNLAPSTGNLGQNCVVPEFSMLIGQ